MEARPIPCRNQCRNCLVGFIRIAVEVGTSNHQRVGRGDHRLLVQKTMKYAAAPRNRRLNHDDTPARAKNAFRLSEERRGKLQVMKDVDHDDVGGNPRGEREALRVRDAIEMGRELDLTCDALPYSLFYV